MTISNIAQRDVVTATRDQTAGNLATLLKEEDVGCVVIVEDDEPVGIVTDRDLAIEVLEPRADPREVTAGDVMTPDPTTAHVDDGIFEATTTLLQSHVRRLPIVDDDGKLAGIVTLDDFVVLFTDELNGLTGVIEAESRAY